MKRGLVVVIAALLGSAVGNSVHTTFVAPETGGARGQESEPVITGSLVASAAAALAGFVSRRWGWLMAFIAAVALTAVTGAELDRRVAEIAGRGATAAPPGGEPAEETADEISD